MSYNDDDDDDDKEEEGGVDGGSIGANLLKYFHCIFLFIA